MPAFAFLVLGLVGFVPLFGPPGYETALFMGLFVPSVAAIDRALWVGRRLTVDRRVGGGELVRGVLGGGALYLALLLASATAHGLRSGFCEPLEEFPLLVLGPGAGVFLGAAFGVSVGVLTPVVRGRRVRRGWLALLAVAGPVCSALASISTFYFTPSVAAFDAFVGHFKGPLYDVVEFELSRLLTYRVGTLLTVSAVVTFLSGVGLVLAPDGRVTARFRSTGRLLLAFVLLGGSAAHLALSAELGFVATPGAVTRALPARLSAGECVVRFSPWVAERVAASTLRECQGHVAQLRSRFGLRGSEAVTVLLFADEAEKAALIGARSTYIAKPWRREVYVQAAAFPHPVLGHEIAHVLLGEIGQGPFRISGLLGGLIPDPGRIEGMAVFAAPREGGEGTTREWAASMAEVGELPPARRLFSLGFLGESAVRSYTAAGAFVEFIAERFGIEVVLGWYGGRSLVESTGRDWETLDGEFRGWLKQGEVPASLRTLAKLRFGAPGRFERRCPHAAARALGRAEVACSNRPSEVELWAERALAFDGSEHEARAMVPGCLGLAGDLEQAAERARILASDSAYADSTRASLHELLGDIAWARGQEPEASAEYERAIAIGGSSATLRALWLKSWAVGRSGAESRAVRALLVRVPLPGEAGLPPGLARARSHLLAWRSSGGAEAGLASYLLGQNMARENPTDALEYLEEALARGLPTPEFEAEAHVRAAVLAIEVGDAARAAAHGASLATLGGTRARREQVERMVERERFVMSQVTVGQPFGR